MAGPNFTQNIALLRQSLEDQGLDAFIIPSTDPHQSEYVASYWATREWISGFTGSAGTVVVTREHAGLWTDSRYFLQAGKELAQSGFTLHKLGPQGNGDHVDWLLKEMSSGNKIGVDGRLISQAEASSLKRRLKGAEIDLSIHIDPIPEVWKDRPDMPVDPVFAHSEDLAGASYEEKSAGIHTKMKVAGATHCLVSALDEIAWLFNLRGSDVAYCPVFYAYALLGPEGDTLFINEVKVPAKLRKDLIEGGVRLLPYDAVEKELLSLSANSSVLFDPAKTSTLLANALTHVDKIEESSPISLAKAIKNNVEIDHLGQTMIKDGTALVRLFMWLEETLADEVKVTESQVAEKLAGFRSAQEGYVSESFPAIVGYGPNGAIVHYRAEPGKDLEIKPEGILLLDSGGQYIDGTTDVTRTITLGEPSFEQILHYTTVLKGHIALAKAAFPKGTNGSQLDVLARAPLWEEGLNYGHGTGHGVGFFLNVHEGPHGIRPNASGSGIVPIEPGMVTSNEPGFYLEGEYGIRIENLVVCEPFTESDFGEFYCFENLTLFPMDFDLVDFGMLGPDEIDWLGIYHLRVLTELEPALEDDEVEWLTSKCMPFVEIHEAQINLGLDEFDLDDLGLDDEDWHDIGLESGANISDN